MTNDYSALEYDASELGPVVDDKFGCPNCGSHTFECVSDGEITNFLCLTCHDCWHWELNYMSVIDPRTCPGCHNIERCLEHSGAFDDDLGFIDPRNEFVVPPTAPQRVKLSATRAGTR